MSTHWKCPHCGAILEKGGFVARGGLDLSALFQKARAIGTATCGACGAEFQQSDVYGGKYDIDLMDDSDAAKGSSVPSTRDKAPQAETLHSLVWTCVSCGKKLKASENLAGKKAECPGCGTIQSIPATRAATEPLMGAADLASPSPKSERGAGEIISNSLGMKFAWCPPGTFRMGSPINEPDRYHLEIQHNVTLSKGFYLSIHPVTQAQWRAIMCSNPSHSKDDHLPVENVSWEDCLGFCKKLGENDGKRYRLATEAEWEYACRAGTTTAFSFGNHSKDLGDYAWYGDNAGKRTRELGTKKPNAWGLYDMHGNVWEWCQDWFGWGPYPAFDVVDPQGDVSGSDHVMRGGSWAYDAGACRAAYRSGGSPSFRNYDVGCRVVLCLD